MDYFKPYFWILVVAVLLSSSVYFIFNSGTTATCFWGLVIAITLFWVREKHQSFYGLTEVVAGLFILGQSYPNGRGAFSSAFAEAFQPFQWNVVLISTSAAVYIMVRGMDNIKRGWGGS
jgi:hypothetical protein